MKHNMLRLDMQDIVRRQMSAKLVKFADKKLPRGLAMVLPEYTVVLPDGFQGDNVRYLATLTTRHQGKRRIYSDVGGGANPLHLYYVSKRDVIRLNGRGGMRVALSNDKHFATIFDLGLADRWCLAVDKPISACRTVGEWLHTLICVERAQDKSNHPPSGDTALAGTWTMGPYAEDHFKHDSTSSNLTCVIQRRRA